MIFWENVCSLAFYLVLIVLGFVIFVLWSFLHCAIFGANIYIICDMAIEKVKKNKKDVIFVSFLWLFRRFRVAFRGVEFDFPPHAFRGRSRFVGLQNPAGFCLHGHDRAIAAS